MSENTNADLMAEFQEFLNAKREKENAETQAEDFEVEIWDKDGRGVRTRRSHAKPFLQSLGIDMDESDGDSGKSGDGESGDKKPSSRKSTGKTSNAVGSASTVRKYFAKPNPK